MYEKLVLKDVRFVFPHVITPKQWEDGSCEYSVIVVIPKDHPQIKEINKIEQMLFEDTKKNHEAFAKSKRLQTAWTDLLKDGDEYLEEKGEYLEDCYFFTAKQPIKSEKDSIVVVDRNNKVITEDGVLYSGCWGNISLQLRNYKYSDKYGISSYLKGIQMIEDGDRIGSGGGSAANDFQAVDPEEHDFNKADDLPY